MAKYTVELGDIVKSGLTIFNFDYTFYDETKKTDFEEKFINHFYFREIGQETVGRFQHYLKCKCNERLPYYNELLKLAVMEYDILHPYSIVEDYSKTDSKNTTSNGTQTGTTNRTTNANTTGSKTNTLTSDTDHTENVGFTKDESITENGTVDNDTTVTVDNKKVESDTPNGLLAMSDIKGNVYASKAGIEDGTTTTTDKQDSTASKTGNSTETTDRTTNDNINATSHDITSDTASETATEGISNTANTTGQESGTENYTLNRKGHIGVQTQSELVMKHIELLQQVQTVYLDFFNECEELFMQIY